MLAAISGSGKIQIEQLPAPVPGQDEALIRVMAVGVCETDVHLTLHSDTPPRLMGHEWSGVIERAPENSSLEIGSRAVGEGMVGCGRCRPCKRGSINLCDSYKEIGFSLPGAYAEYLVLPASNLHRLPDSLSFEGGALIEPAAVALHALDLAEIAEGEDVAVIGPGPIGLLAVQLARALGAGKVALTGTRQNRLDLGRELGADLIVDAAREDPVEAVRGRTDGGPDAVIDAAGTPSSFHQALGMVAKGGTVVLIGGWDEVTWRPGTIIGKEVTLTGSLASPDAWERAIGYISAGKVRVKPLITHKFPLARIADAFDLVDRKGDGLVKALVLPAS